jgi:hypothetical protein
MQSTRPALSKYICGMAASLIIFLAGGWLILAPFALGYQPYGASWVDQTTNNFVTGIPVAVVALAAFALFFASLIGSLRAGGILAARRPAQVPAMSQPQATPAPAPQSDLDQTLATLAAALAADMAARRQTANLPPVDQSVEQNVNRRDI